MSLKDKITKAVRSLDGNPTALDVSRAFEVLCQTADRWNALTDRIKNDLKARRDALREYSQQRPTVYCCRCFDCIGSLRHCFDDGYAPVGQMKLPTYNGNVVCPNCVGAFIQEHEDDFNTFVRSGREINLNTLREHLEEEIDE